jgi:hypothetical protein
MNLNLSDEQLRDLVVEALFQKISPDERKQMITEALANLMKPQEGADRWAAKKPSKLQEATDNALLRVAIEVIREELAKPEVRAQISGLVVDALAKTFGANREQSVDRISLAMAHALANSDR